MGVCMYSGRQIKRFLCSAGRFIAFCRFSFICLLKSLFFSFQVFFAFFSTASWYKLHQIVMAEHFSYLYGIQVVFIFYKCNAFVDISPAFFNGTAKVIIFHDIRRDTSAKLLAFDAH